MTEIPLYPPLEWFTPPKDMPKDAGCVVELNGRIYGYLMHWGSVLMDGSKDRWTPPRSKNQYAYAHTGDTVVEGGETIKTANLGGDFGHAPTGSGDLAATQAFYENTQTQLARVRYGEDANGVWFAGSCWPNVSEFDMAKLRASARSGHWCALGDWRDMQSGRVGYELVGACLVNVPGLKYARADRAASGVLSFNPVSVGGEMTNRDARIERVASSGSVLLAVEEEAAEAAADIGVGGVLLVEGSQTEDGRLIEAGATEWRELPLALYSSLLNLPGHDSAALVGRIEEIYRDEADPNVIRWSGFIVPALADGGGQATVDAISAKALQGISIDGIVGPNDSYFNDEDVSVMSRIVIAGATLTPMPAIGEATVTLLSADLVQATCGDDHMDDEADIDVVVDEVIADDNSDADRDAALSDQIAALSERVEYLISVVESQHLNARAEAAAAKVKH